MTVQLHLSVSAAVALAWRLFQSQHVVAMAAMRDAGDDADDVMTMTSPINATEATSSAAVRYGIAELLATLVTLVAVILATIIGNAFVIAAVVLERNLRSHVANYLVASLAVADFLVALLVMPLAAVNEVCAALSFFLDPKAGP